MSQLGMQMPGAQRSRKPALNVYTGLALAATLSLGAACALVYLNSQKIAPQDGGVLQIHPADKPIKLAN